MTVQTWRHLALWRGAQEVEWITIALHAPADLTLCEMVVEHLKSLGLTSETLAPEKILELIKEEKLYRDVWETFLRFPGMPIVSERAVREAVKAGIKRGLFGLRVDEKIYSKQDVPDADLELESIRLMPEVAPSTTPPPPSAPEYLLHVKAPLDRLSEFARGVILPLRRAADELEVEIRVHARNAAGLPEHVIENPVRETIKQLQIQVLKEELK